MGTLVLHKQKGIKKMLLEQKMLNSEKLNIDEAATNPAVSPSQLHRLTGSGKIPVYKSNGRKLYIDRHDLDTWLMIHSRFSGERFHQQNNQINQNSGRI